jgi:hypothetical protein
MQPSAATYSHTRERASKNESKIPLPRPRREFFARAGVAVGDAMWRQRCVQLVGDLLGC